MSLVNVSCVLCDQSFDSSLAQCPHCRGYGLKARPVEIEHDLGTWTVWVRDVLGSERGIPLGSIIQDFLPWDPSRPSRVVSRGYKVSLVGECWSKPGPHGPFLSFDEAVEWLCENQPYKGLKVALKKETQ